MGVYLRAKFEVSSIILTSFRQGEVLPPSQPQNKPPKSPPRLGLIHFSILKKVVPDNSFSTKKLYLINYMVFSNEYGKP